MNCIAKGKPKTLCFDIILERTRLFDVRIRTDLLSPSFSDIPCSMRVERYIGTFICIRKWASRVCLETSTQSFTKSFLSDVHMMIF